MTAISAPQDNPFIGARPYDTGENSLFLGRNAEIRDLASLWKDNRLTILHSASGAGKTSLLRAGVIPELREHDKRPLPVGRTPSTRVWPTAALPQHNPYLVGLLSSWEPGEMPARLTGLSLLDYLRRREIRDGHGVPTLVAIDQAETFLRPPTRHEQHARRFIEELFETVEGLPRLHLLLSVRTEHLDELSRLVKASGIAEPAEFELRPFSPETAARVVEQMVVTRGHRSDQHHIVSVLDELRTIRDEGDLIRNRLPTVDPALLQVVGSHFWGHPALVPAAGDVDAALLEFCASTLAEVAADLGILPRTLDTWMRGADPVTGEISGPALHAPVVHALEDRYLVREGARVHARLLAPMRRLDLSLWPAVSRNPRDRLSAAVEAGFAGEFDRAGKLLQDVARTCPPGATRTRAEMESLLGNLAATQDLLPEAERHYETAAGLYEVLRDNSAVSWSLAALGRIALRQGKRACAIEELRAAVSRAPHDLTVHTSLGEVLWKAGQPRAALSVLSGVVDREADVPGARRLRHAILADLEKG